MAEKEMTQDERWIARYKEVREFIETTHRNPSRHFVENRNLLSWVKQQRKLLNAGELKAERMEKFKELVKLNDTTKNEEMKTLIGKLGIIEIKEEEVEKKVEG